MEAMKDGNSEKATDSCLIWVADAGGSKMQVQERRKKKRERQQTRGRNAGGGVEEDARSV